MKFHFKAIHISKIAVLGIFLNYYCFNLITGHLIPFGTYIFFGLAILGLLISAYKEPIRFSFDIKCWLLYFLMSAALIPFAMSKLHAFNGLRDYFQRLILIIVIAYICEREKSIKYAIRLLAVTASACAVTSLFMMNSYNQKLSMSSGATISTNDIGSLMAFGCFAVIIAFGIGENSRLHKTIFKFAYVITAVVVISIAGSRKSIIAIIIMFIALFLFCARDYFKNITSLRFVGIAIILIAAFIFVYVYLLPNYEDTNLFIRTAGRQAERTANSDQTRIDYYIIALEDFRDNLFFGLGFNNYKYIHHNYSHSTYVEPLACSGLLGLLYLAPYMHIFVNQIKLSFNKKFNLTANDRLFQKELLAFYISFLFIGIGIPYIYKDLPCIILAMFIAWQKISLTELAENSHEILTEEEKNARKTIARAAG